ncbi:MAG: type I methionyl aminopeptidase [Actinomycetia bacterium]|nr:type I methionyl aminopeptidase [Actinomycetes bacterium]
MGFFRRERLQGKTPEQLIKMRAAGLVVGRTLNVLRESTSAGMTTKELDTIAEEHIRSSGAVPSFLGYHGFTGTICASVNEEIVHGIPGTRVLADGDLISIDCGAIVDGWHGDAAISFVVGGRDQGRPEDLQLIDATEAALYAGIAALRVGERLFDVGAGVEDEIEAAGERDGRAYGIVEDYVGHGIGTAMHMEPNVPNYRCRDKGPIVVDGTTVAIEPMITLGDQANDVLEDNWTVVTRDGQRAAHWEHSVAATTKGLWIMTAVDGGREWLTRLGAPFAPLAD